MPLYGSLGQSKQSSRKCRGIGNEGIWCRKNLECHVYRIQSTGFNGVDELVPLYFMTNGEVLVKTHTQRIIKAYKANEVRDSGIQNFRFYTTVSMQLNMKEVVSMQFNMRKVWLSLSVIQQLGSGRASGESDIRAI